MLPVCQTLLPQGRILRGPSLSTQQETKQGYSEHRERGRDWQSTVRGLGCAVYSKVSDVGNLILSLKYFAG